MKQVLVLMSLVALLLTGCASVSLVPEQVVNGRIDVADKSQTIVTQGVEVTARVDETGISAYNLDGTVTAFFISIRNSTDREISFGDDSYLLVDEGGVQYSLLSPDQIRTMLKKDSYYLIPYPYVGFYYLEDYEKTNAYGKASSALPYYYDLYPQDLFARSLPATTIIPGMKVEGLTYFKIDPAAHKKVTLLIYRKGASKSSPPDFSFPFKTVK